MKRWSKHHRGTMSGARLAQAALCALGLGLAAREAAASEFLPDGKTAVGLLFGPSSVPESTVRAEVRKQGFYLGAGGPTEAFGAGLCANCHPDVAAQWAGSAHRFASFNNPFYAVSVEQFRRDRGLERTRFCGNCHDPLLVASGAFDASTAAHDAKIDAAAPNAQAGIVCLVCHSIDTVSLAGNGEHRVVAEPVPLGRPVHGQRLRRPILGEPRLCGSCHRVALVPEVTDAHWLRGQDDYGAWQASAVAGQGSVAIFRPAQTSRCQDCHMPYEPAPLGDAAARPGPDGTPRVRSHRFLGGNTALPTLRGDEDMVRREAEFLQGAVTLALHSVGPVQDAPGGAVGAGATATAGGVYLVYAVLRNRRVGHRFPGGTMDSNEVWLEVEALGPDGRVLARSGGRDSRGVLREDTHLVRVQPVDGAGHPLLKRDPQNMRGVVYDTALTPSDPVAVRFLVPRVAATVRARLLYRKFSPAFAALACAGIADPAVRRRCADLPAVEVARAETSLGVWSCPSAADDERWRALVDHGVGLAAALAEEASAAEPILACARALRPDRPEPLLGLGRLALALGQVDQAVTWNQQALALAPGHPAALLGQARALYRAYRFADARPPIEALALRLPDDPNALGLLARVRGVLGDPRGALAAADHLLVVDPDAAEGHWQRSLALGDLGDATGAAAAAARYYEIRPRAELDLALRQRFRALYPARAQEDLPVHVHVLR